LSSSDQIVHDLTGHGLFPLYMRILGAEEHSMLRRSLFKAVAALAGTAGIIRANEVDRSPRPGRGGTNPKKVPAHNFVEAPDGTNLFFRDAGAGKPMLFVAPWALNSAWWEYQVYALAGQGIRCITYDRRGHGRSGESNRKCDLDTIADDLAEVVEQLGLHDVTLVGHSLGCGEVVRYLTRHGSARISRVVLVATITPSGLKTDDNPDGGDPAAAALVRETLAKDHAHPLAAYAPTFFGAPRNQVSQEIMDWWVRMMVDGCSLKTMNDLQKIFSETDFRPELPKISVPTLLIHGDNDKSTPIDTTARRTAPLLRGSQLKVYEGAAHGLPITHAAQLNADLVAFSKQAS
jgi:non-heme chloroperoxidase